MSTTQAIGAESTWILTIVDTETGERGRYYYSTFEEAEFAEDHMSKRLGSLGMDRYTTHIQEVSNGLG